MRSLLVFLALTQCENVAFTETGRRRDSANLSEWNPLRDPDVQTEYYIFLRDEVYFSREAKGKLGFLKNLFELRSAEFHIDMDD